MIQKTIEIFQFIAPPVFAGVIIGTIIAIFYALALWLIALFIYRK